MASRHACTDPHHHVDSADAFVRAVQKGAPASAFVENETATFESTPWAPRLHTEQSTATPEAVQASVTRHEIVRSAAARGATVPWTFCRKLFIPGCRQFGSHSLVRGTRRSSRSSPATRTPSATSGRGGRGYP